MFKLHSVTGRIAIGKIIGCVLGLFAMIFLPVFDMPILSMFGFGTLLMFIFMGAMIGFFGIFDRHPALNFKMKWWFRGAYVGGTFMLMYILLSYNTLEIVMSSTLVSWTGLESPFWMILDGMFIGAMMGLIETKLAGEGKNLPQS